MICNDAQFNPNHHQELFKISFKYIKSGIHEKKLYSAIGLDIIAK